MEPLNLANVVLSIILGIVSIIFVSINIFQLVRKKEEDTSFKATVGTWQNSASGVKNALLGIAQNPTKFSQKEDMAAAVTSVAQSAIALDQSMVEKRFYSEDEIKIKREESEKQMKALLAQVNSRNNSSSSS